MSNRGQRRADKERRRKHRKGIRKVTIVTEGRKVSGLPFMGEEMICVMCGKSQKSDPAVESNWRSLSHDGKLHYACPEHFPSDAMGTVEQFKAAYVAFLGKILANA